MLTSLHMVSTHYISITADLKLSGPEAWFQLQMDQLLFILGLYTVPFHTLLSFLHCMVLYFTFSKRSGPSCHGLTSHTGCNIIRV